MTVSELERHILLPSHLAEYDCGINDDILALITDYRLAVSALQEIASHGERPGDTIEIRLARANLSWTTAVRTLTNLKVRP